MRTVQFVWILLVAAVTITSYTGNATPYIEPTQLPAGGTAEAGTYIFGTILVVGFGGAAAMALATGDPWKQMDEEMDLTLSDSGSGRGTYTGTVNGREVRARLDKRKSGGQTEGGSSYTTYTITEADLDAPIEGGIILRRETDEAGRMDVSDSAAEQVVINDEFVLTGVESEQRARKILTQDVREAIRAVEGLETMTIGAASEVIAEDLPSMGNSMIGGFLENKMEQAMTKDIGGTPTTVGIETKGLVNDSSVLNSRIVAVAAVAEVFEEANTK